MGPIKARAAAKGRAGGSGVPNGRSTAAITFTKAKKREQRLMSLPPTSHTVKVEADEETKRQLEEGKKSQEELRSELQEMKRMFQATQQSVANTGDLELLRAKLVSIERDLREKDSEVNRLRLEMMQKNSIHDSTKVDLESRLRTEQEKRQTLEQKVLECNTAISCLEHEKSAITTRLETHKTQTEHLEKACTEKDSTVQELRLALEHVKDSIESEKSSRERTEALYNEAELKIETFTNEMSQLQKDSDEKLKELKKVIEEKESLVDEKCRLKEALDTEKENLRNERELLTTIKKELEEAKANQDDKYGQLKQEYESFRANTESKLGKIEEAKRSVEGAHSNTQNELETFRATCQSYKGAIANQETTIISLKAKITALESRIEALSGELEGKVSDVAELRATIEQQTEAIKQLEEQARADEDARRKLHNAVQELKGNIRVYCRVRPILGSEVDSENPAGCEESYKYVDRKQGLIAIQPLSTSLKKKSSSTNIEAQEWSFKFDHVFGPSSKQQDVFIEISQLVQSALDGYKVCIFAYGQTGSGKTHTMLGDTQNEENLGMIPRSVQQIFDAAEKLAKDEWEFKLKASFLEIYNETVRDLLTDSRGSNDTKKTYAIQYNADAGRTSVSGLTVVDVDSPEQVKQLIKKSIRNRATAATNANERSSRSHSVFRLQISGFNKLSGQKLDGLLNLIDLAGSERLKMSGARGARLKETQHINKSLSALGDVIASLANKDRHIPYRNSKLTYLLQDSLGGDSKTLMFVNISPVEQSFNESLCSLRFASKVNACDIGTARRTTKIDLSV